MTSLLIKTIHGRVEKSCGRNMEFNVGNLVSARVEVVLQGLEVALHPRAIGGQR